MKKTTLSLLLMIALCLALAACGDAPAVQSPETEKDPQAVQSSPPGHSQTQIVPNRPTEESPPSGSDPNGESWAIYWYLCGSDLESWYGCATDDLLEMLEVELPPNVQVVIQTGGAQEWWNDTVVADCLERYVYSSNGFEFIEQLPQASMGDPGTLADFLGFCKNNYPADRTMVLFWNHGGGSVSGAMFDENFWYDSMTLGEFYEAFNEVYELDLDNPPIDVIGFDACLMATIDTAYTFSDVAHYLVASEELEPGNGWYYTGWLGALANDPSMDGADLGRAICDSYVDGCEMYWTEDEITLSVTDLTQIGPLVEAYDAMGQEALVSALDDPRFFSSFGRAASRSESYGGNSAEEGYTNMVDLGHLARNSGDILPETTQDVLDGLEQCVVYQVNGPYRSEASGLSCYYSYNGDWDDYYGYTDIACSEAFTYLYSYELSGSLDSAGMAYIDSLGFGEEALPEIPSLESEAGGEDFPVYVDDDGYAVLDIGPEVANILKGVYFQLAYVDWEYDILLLLGRDNDIFMDWENGVFMDNFRGVWGSIDDCLVYMELVYEGVDYNTYTVPILLNGEEYNLRVVYDYNDECYYILGARKGLEDTGMADKNLLQLQPGDVITTIHYAATISGDDDFEAFEVDTLTVTEDTAFYETDMGDGEFMILFEMVDARNDTLWSEPAFFTVEGDEIWTTVYD